ncbi:hypothetical protein I4U23_023373 [Adineta vaga]|nr:hypothetical protein I4U23_023373 [Adineta vaga]
MEEDNLATQKTTKLNYMNLLREINELSNLSTHLTNPNISKIENIFNNVTKNIDQIWDQMTFEKSSMLLITISNTIMRISAIDESDLLISQKSFQSMYNSLNDLIIRIYNRKECSPIYASNILDAMFMNLIKDDLIENCRKRLHSTEVVSTIDSTTTNRKSPQDNKIQFHDILQQYIEHTNIFLSAAVIRSKYEFGNHYSSLMISFKEFINDCLTIPNENVSSGRLTVTSSILLLIWNLTDKIPLIPIFINLGYVQKTIQWIRTDTFKSHIDSLCNPIISIIYNLSRDQKGLKQFRTEKAFDVLMECSQLINETNDEDLTKSFGIALIALATSDEQSEENKKLILDTSVKLYQLCKTAEANVELNCDGYHLSELLELLHRAFINTYVIKHILENKIDEKPTAIQYFAELLLILYGALLDPEPDELEKRAVKYLLKILLQISSYPEYVKQLIDNNQFCIIIESLANRPNRDDAKRIWCNIQQIIVPNKPQKEMLPMIYISYDSTNEDFCKTFIKELRKKVTVPIWVDYEKVDLGEDMWEYISPVIISATVVIILISTAYEDNTDKFQELSYIISTNKSRHETKGLVVVTTEPDFNFKRSWIKDLLYNKIVILYDDNVSYMASKVSEQIGMSKKSLIKRLRYRMKNVQKKDMETDNYPANSEERNLKSITTNDFSLAATNSYVPKKSSNTTDDTNSSSTTKKPGSHCIVAGLMTHTGSAGHANQM